MVLLLLLLFLLGSCFFGCGSNAQFIGFAREGASVCPSPRDASTRHSFEQQVSEGMNEE